MKGRLNNKVIRGFKLLGFKICELQVQAFYVTLRSIQKVREIYVYIFNTFSSVFSESFASSKRKL